MKKENGINENTTENVPLQTGEYDIEGDCGQISSDAKDNTVCGNDLGEHDLGDRKEQIRLSAESEEHEMTVQDEIPEKATSDETEPGEFEKTSDVTDSTAIENNANGDISDIIDTENSASDIEPASETDLSAEDFAMILKNPMFAVFARGRKGDIMSAARDFSYMLEMGRGELSEYDRMKMTPSAGAGLAGVSLSEGQRKLARDAGMSYAEYYDLIRAIPEKNKR